MMEEDEISDAGGFGDAHAFAPARMSPPAVTLEFLGGVLRVIDENIRCFGKAAQIAVVFEVSRLVIGGVDDCPNSSLDAIAEAALGMIEPASGHARFADRETIAPSNIGEFAICGHSMEVDREVGMSHLRFENALEAILPDEFRSETVKMKLVVRRIQGREKGDALNVVPMVVGHEDVGLNGFFGGGRQAIAKNPQAGAAIEDEATPVGRNEFEARRITAIAPGGPIHRRCRTSHAPEAKFGYVFCHEELRDPPIWLRLLYGGKPFVNTDLN